VSPASTTTYTATATGTGGNGAATTTVTVASGPAATVTIAASPASITAGNSSSLAVTATNATAVSVAGTDGSSYTLAATGGTQVVSPAATTTYTVTATGAGGNATATATVTVAAVPQVTVSIQASPTSISAGATSNLTVAAANATSVVVTGSDGSSYTLADTGGTQAVSPTATTIFTATAEGEAAGLSATAATTVQVGSAQAINHVIFMMQENRTFDTYFGMLNPYRQANGWNVGDDGVTYNVDGIEDKLNITNEDNEGDVFPLFKFASTCMDDSTSGWLESFGDMNRYNFAETRPIKLDGFVHDARVMRQAAWRQAIARAISPIPPGNAPWATSTRNISTTTTTWRRSLRFLTGGSRRSRPRARPTGSRRSREGPRRDWCSIPEATTTSASAPSTRSSRSSTRQACRGGSTIPSPPVNVSIRKIAQPAIQAILQPHSLI